MRLVLLRGVVASTLTVLIGLLASCGSSETGTGATTTSGTTTGDTGGGGATGSGGTGGATTTPTPEPSWCIEAGLPQRAFAEGPYGIHRHETADDFTVDLADGTTWNLKEQWSGCESYVFLPDTLRVSDLVKTPIWEKDLDKLIKAPPQNVHYFFVSRASADDAAKLNTDAMQVRIEAQIAKLAEPLATHWKTRLHVVAKRAGLLDNWLKDELAVLGRGGFAIDRFQRIRGVGNLADVNRYKQALQDGGFWPWEQNLAYAANEVRYYNFEVEREAKLEAENATIVPFYNGEILSELEETDVELPSEADMAKFDTLEVDVTSLCPDPEKIEFGNCGAWDYLAHLFVQDENGANVEIARFITSYHRETRWIVDISPMLAHLKKGGMRHFRWEFAPPWNVQPTATKLSLRLSNKSKGVAPQEATFLFGGGSFNDMYNATYMPIDVPIPADAKHVELVAVITGHGADGTTSCAEFCNHQHVFTVNGVEHKKLHPEAGTGDKCVAHIEQGMVPNQGGTWWFGRGGWCPGQQVDPWVVDVTANVTPGEIATVSYQGLFKNAQPPAGEGNILMNSYLVVYK